jgi:hypothetical protein
MAYPLDDEKTYVSKRKICDRVIAVARILYLEGETS